MAKRQFNAISDSSSSASKKPKLEITATSTIFMTNMLRLPKTLVDSSDDIVSEQRADPTEKSYKNKQEQELLPELNILESDFNRSESNSSISSSESSEISRPQTPVREQTSDNRHLQSQTDEVNVTLAISSRRLMPVLFDASQFSEDEAEDLLEEMEDALDAMRRFGYMPQFNPQDRGYCSEQEVDNEEVDLDDF